MAGRPPSPELHQFLKPYDPAVVRLALALRALVVEEAPTATEIVYDGSYTVSIIFSFTAKWTDGFCHVVPCSDHVNLGFNRGAELPDPAGRLQGTGKQIRHIKVKTEDDLKKAMLRDFVRLAISHSLNRTPPEKLLESAEEPIVMSYKGKKRRPKRK